MSKAKGKDKKEKLSEDEAEVSILNYLTQQNRPVNAQIIMDSLHVGKAQATKVLTNLSDKGLIIAKGEKAKIYWKKQEEEETNGEGLVRDLDTNIAKQTSEHATLSQDCKDLDTKVKQLNNRMTDEVLEAELKRLAAENKQCTSKLAGLASNKVAVSPQERQKIETRYEKTRKAWSTRKRKCKEILDGLAEAGKAKKDLLEEIDFETDESKGVVLGEDLLAKRRKIK